MTRKATPDDRLARQLGLRGAPHGWIGLAVLILMISALIFATTATESAIRPLTVSLTFDDSRANQLPSSACLTGGGVAIGAGDDAQSVVNGHPPGTTYIVKAGIHLRNFSVQPKSGDKFCGEPGAVLDGGRSLPSAFSAGRAT